MKVLVLGINGLIGSSIFRVLSRDQGLDVYGTLRNTKLKNYFKLELHEKIFSNIDVLSPNILDRLFEKFTSVPDYIINCIGITKHNDEIKDFNKTIKINSILPHQIDNLIRKTSTRLIHISTDCVFSGKKGLYTEKDKRDATDIYGKSKIIGEDLNGNSIIVRTSTIGHELIHKRGLLEWFLKLNDQCQGFQRAYFSGLPTICIGEIIKNFVIKKKIKGGIYNVSSKRINKYDLLNIIKIIYMRDIEIIPNNDFVIDRSLDGSKFCKVSGYVADDWEKMIKKMFYDKRENYV